MKITTGIELFVAVDKKEKEYVKNLIKLNKNLAQDRKAFEKAKATFETNTKIAQKQNLDEKTALSTFIQTNFAKLSPKEQGRFRNAMLSKAQDAELDNIANEKKDLQKELKGAIKDSKDLANHIKNLKLKLNNFEAKRIKEISEKYEKARTTNYA